MAKSPTEHVRDLMAQLGVLQERDLTRRQELDEIKARVRQERDERKAENEKHQDDITELRKENADLRRELAEARQEYAVLKQQLQDHIKQTDLADSRRWGLFVLLLGAVMSLASGLIVSPSRK